MGGHLGETRPCIIVVFVCLVFLGFFFFLGGGGGGALRGDSTMRYSGRHFGETFPCIILGGTSWRLARAL